MHDIWDINPADASAELVPEFDEQWRLNVEKNEKSRSRSKKVDEKEAAKEKEFGKKTHVRMIIYFESLYTTSNQILFFQGKHCSSTVRSILATICFRGSYATSLGTPELRQPTNP